MDVPDWVDSDITPQSVTRTIKAMPEQELPGGGGATFRCGGSAVPSLPAVCTNQWLRATLDADGMPTGYEVEDSSDILDGLERRPPVPWSLSGACSAGGAAPRPTRSRVVSTNPR